MTPALQIPAAHVQRRSVHALGIQTIHDAMAAEGWRSVLIDTGLDSHRHLVMRQFNQLALVHVDAVWDGIRLTALDARLFRRLLTEAQRLRAIPLRAALDISGQFPVAATSLGQLARRGRFAFSLPHPFLLEDLILDGPFDLGRYDLDQEIEMSHWELQDLAVQTVREQVAARGHEIIRSSSEEDMDPQIVAMIDGRLTFLLVRAARRGEPVADFADTDLSSLAAETARFDALSRCVSVAFVRTGEMGPSCLAGPLYRGQPIEARITGLGAEPLRPTWLH